MKNPVCKNCLNFSPLDESSSIESSKFGLCTKFGAKNMITGEIKYDSAINCRNDASKCSNFGFHFAPNPTRSII